MVGMQSRVQTTFDCLAPANVASLRQLRPHFYPPVGRSANGPQLRSAGTTPLGQKNRLAAAGTRHFFRAQSRGRGKKKRIVGAELAVTSVPVGTPLSACSRAAPTECVAPRITPISCTCAQHETWSRELPPRQSRRSCNRARARTVVSSQVLAAMAWHLVVNSSESTTHGTTPH